MSATDKLFGTTTLNERQAALAKQTYGLLSLSIAGMIAGGYVGATNQSMAMFFSTLPGWLLGLLMINLVPYIAIRAARSNPTMGVIALGADGFISGIAISPLLFFARLLAPQMIGAAAAVTVTVFLAITAYMMTTRDRFSAPRGLLFGLLASVAVTILVATMMPQAGGLGIFLSLLIGFIGVIGLIQSTSEVLNNPDFDSPVFGALCLFAGLFNIFVSTLRLLLSFGSRD
jgi:modulator of FtsH protease